MRQDLKNGLEKQTFFKSVSLNKIVFGPGTLLQAPFFGGKLRFWCWNVAAGFFLWKIVFSGSWNVAAGAFVVKKERKCEPPSEKLFF